MKTIEDLCAYSYSKVIIARSSTMHSSETACAERFDSSTESLESTMCTQAVPAYQ